MTVQIDIRHNIADVKRWLDDAQKKQVPFASILAMTLTARDVKAEEITVMKRVFDRPTPYTLNALQAIPATKQTGMASVEFKTGGGTPAKRFLNPNVHGGPRSQKSHEKQISTILKGYSYLVPARTMPVNAYGNVAGGTFRKIISQLKVSNDPAANASKSSKSRRKRKSQAFFVNPRGNMVMERKGNEVKPALIAVRSPVYRKRFPFYETAQAVVKERIGINFEVAFQRAMANSSYKSARGTKWKY